MVTQHLCVIIHALCYNFVLCVVLQHSVPVKHSHSECCEFWVFDVTAVQRWCISLQCVFDVQCLLSKHYASDFLGHFTSLHFRSSDGISSCLQSSFLHSLVDTLGFGSSGAYQKNGSQSIIAKMFSACTSGIDIFPQRGRSIPLFEEFVWALCVAHVSQLYFAAVGFLCITLKSICFLMHVTTTFVYRGCSFSCIRKVTYFDGLIREEGCAKSTF